MRASLDNFLRSQHGEWFVRSIQIGLGLLFIYASLDKIWNPGLFAKSIANYRLLPLPLLHISAIILPWLELVCGVALVINRYQRAAYILIGSLLLVFILAITSAMARGLDFNCGCFSMNSEESNVGLLKILQNTGLFLSCALMEYRTRVVQPKS
ncbi:MAG: DoxX family membrane protein [FCB group bacterium]|nr:DoxX family membrane protein [FCB group bacterium]MBL7029012.1 DoxX family membrane protein [Candidatus Neomarinimicrobiota bacterium]MBL7122543.1 DoxX family membrane protein [Candidatus Neomarinimicrobiota bacterium]